MKINWKARILCLLVPVLLTGCGGASSEGPPLSLVQGHILINGKPTPGLRVVFQPGSGRSSEGITDAKGHYELNYLPGIKGAIQGTSAVMVTWVGGDGTEQSEFSAERPQTHTEVVNIPPKYNVSTVLRAIVEPGKNERDFDLIK